MNRNIVVPVENVDVWDYLYILAYAHPNAKKLSLILTVLLKIDALDTTYRYSEVNYDNPSR
jgi:hypothetical protein